MPFSIKKQLKTFKRELGKIFPSSTPLKSSESHKYSDETLTFQRIRNDLKNRSRYKDEKNAYRDYSKLCDKILLQQNDCALRCAQEEKVSNLRRSEALVGDREHKDNLKKCNNVLAVEESSGRDSRVGVKDESESGCSFVFRRFAWF